jgi:AcrR family transcriptional regulator
MMRKPRRAGQQRRPVGRADGAATRETILQVAANLASQEGLESLTIGTLAERLGMSKSGLFAHFGSKEELQLATIEAAADRVTAAVVGPALKAPRGIARLSAACDKLIEYLATPQFPGGCFFNMTRAEFHARPGPVRDAILERKQYWRRLLTDLALEAQKRGELRPDVEAAQLAFELEAVMDAASWSVPSKNKQRELEHARQAVRRVLDAAAPGKRKGDRTEAPTGSIRSSRAAVDPAPT